MSVSSQNASTPAAKAPKLRRGQERVSRLLAAAAVVIAERGYDAATMTDIAARAGASIGSLYQFFPTKALIAEALHVGQLEALSALIDAQAAGVAPGTSLSEVAGLLFDAMAAFLAAHPAFIDLAERRDIDPARKAATRADMLARIDRLVAKAIPRPRPERRRAVAVLLLTIMKAVVSLRAAEGETLECQSLSAEFRSMLIAHLGLDAVNIGRAASPPAR